MNEPPEERSPMRNLPGSKTSWSAAAAVLGALAVLAASLTVGTPIQAGGDSTDAEPRDIDDEEGWLNYVDYYVAAGDDEIDEVRAQLIEELDAAESRIDAAIEYLDDDDIEQALLDAADRGVEVRLVADELFEDAEGFESLVEHDDVSVQFGDGELAYLPDPNLSPLLEVCYSSPLGLREDAEYIECTQSDDDPQAPEELTQNTDNVMERPAHFNTMSHTFFLIDDTWVWNIGARLGEPDDETEPQQLWPVFRAMSEELTNSFEREFRQMNGGVFSTTLSVYNGPLKSITHQQPLRMTNRGALRVRFNPQERLVKNVIDETYRARSSVFVMTENLTNEDLIEALKYKQDNGFDVRVMVGQNQAEVTEFQEAIEPLDPVVAPEEMGRLPTMVLIDTERDDDDRWHPRIVQVLSHELWHAQPFEVIINTGDDRQWLGDSDWVRFYPSDTFADGVMWELEEFGMDENEMYNPELDPFVEMFEQMWTEAL